MNEAERTLNVARAEQTRRWRTGESVWVEAIFAAHPELRDRTEDALILVGGEMVLRRELGEEPSLDEYRRRFPDLADDIALVFAAQAALDGGRPVAPLAVDGYVILGEIGRGAMGVVYKARQVHLDRTVALKVVLAGSLADRTAADRFRAEARAVARLQHPNVLQIFEVGTAGPMGGAAVPFLALEYVEGPSLAQLCGGQPQAIGTSAGWIETLADAIHVAHAAGIIHRDLKPSNVLLTAAGVPKIADFGLAKLLDAGDATASGAVLGTAAYMAPEQAEGRGHRAGPACDVYSLGVILYELLTGQPPFSGTTVLEVLRRVTVEAPRPPTRLRPDVPRDLETICLMCLEKDPARRYGSAAALADDLRRFRAGEPVAARPVGPAGRAWRWARRNPRVAALTATVAGLLLALASGATVAAVRFRASERRTQEQLLDSLIAQSEANRLSRRPGQRFASLRLVSRAADLARKLGIADARGDELRTAAIATLALPDLEPGDVLPGTYPPGSQSVSINEAFSLVAVTDANGDCTVRRGADGVELHRLPGRGRPAEARLNRDGTRLAVRDASSELRLWRLGGAKPTLIYEGQSDTQFVFRDDGRWLALAGTDGGIVVVDANTGRELYRITPERLGRDLKIALHPSQPLVAACSYYGQAVLVRDLRIGAVVADLPHPDGANHAVWSPDGRTLATAGKDGSIRLFDTDPYRPRLTLGPCDPGADLFFDRSGDRLLCVGWPGVLYYWDVVAGRELFRAPALSLAEQVKYPRFDRSGERLVASVRGDGLVAWRVATGREYTTMVSRRATSEANFGPLAIHPGGRILAAGTAEGVCLWDVERGEELPFLAAAGSGTSVGFGADGGLLAATGEGVVRWPVAVGGEAVHIGPPARLTTFPADVVSSSRDGRTVLIFDRRIGARAPYAGIWVWRAESPTRPERFVPGDNGFSTTLSLDGRWLCADDGNGTFRLWDVPARRLVRTHAGIGQPSGRFHPDCRLLATNFDGGRAWTLDAKGQWADGPRLGGTYDFAFASDGTILADPLPAGVVRLLDAATGRERARLVDPERRLVSRPAIAQDGGRLAGAENSGPVHVWDLRRLRTGLAALGLDRADLPFPPASSEAPPPPPLRVTVIHEPMAAPVEPSDAADVAYRRGLDALARGDWPVAASELTTAVDADPVRWDARGHRAIATRRLGRTIDAAADRAALNAEAAIWFYWTGAAHFAGGDHRLAAACFDEALALNADDRRSMRYLAECLLLGPESLRDGGRALELIERALRAAPASPTLRMLRGVGLLRVGRDAEACDDLAANLKVCEKVAAPTTGYFLAIGLFHRGDAAGASTAFAQAERSLPAARAEVNNYGHHVVAVNEVARAEAFATLGSTPAVTP